jgi:hypothetical protein
MSLIFRRQDLPSPVLFADLEGDGQLQAIVFESFQAIVCRKETDGWQAIWLAARNSVHTWSTGIVGCGVFVAVVIRSQLYADTTLQCFFIVASSIGVRIIAASPKGDGLRKGNSDRSLSALPHTKCNYWWPH